MDSCICVCASSFRGDAKYTKYSVERFNHAWWEASETLRWVHPYRIAGVTSLRNRDYSLKNTPDPKVMRCCSHCGSPWERFASFSGPKVPKSARGPLEIISRPLPRTLTTSLHVTAQGYLQITLTSPRLRKTGSCRAVLRLLVCKRV